MVLFSHEVGVAEADACRLVEAFFEHLNLSVELLSQVKEDLLFAQRVAVKKELKVWASPPIGYDHFTELMVCDLL